MPHTPETLTNYMNLRFTQPAQPSKERTQTTLKPDRVYVLKRGALCLAVGVHVVHMVMVYAYPGI